MKRHCEHCNNILQTKDRRVICCCEECKKAYKKEYQKGIPIELKRKYRKDYEAKNPDYKRKKNLRYRMRN